MATTLLTGGTVQRMDGDPRTDEAIVVSDGRVQASGSDADMRVAAGADAQVIDLAGATVIPGLVDTHPHLMHFGALAEAPVDLSDATSHDEIVDRLRARAAETPPGEWVMGTPVGEPHYFIRRSWRDLAEGALPGRDVLDRASQDHPIWIQAWAPVTPNVTAFNSAGLRKIGITATRPQAWGTSGSTRTRTASRPGSCAARSTPTTTTSRSGTRSSRTCRCSRSSRRSTGTIKAMGLYNALGVTTVYEGHVMGIDEINGYRMLRAGDLLSVRVLAAPDAEPYAFPWVPRLSDDGVRGPPRRGVGDDRHVRRPAAHRRHHDLTRRPVLARLHGDARALPRTVRPSHNRHPVHPCKQGGAGDRVLRGARAAAQHRLRRGPRARRVSRPARARRRQARLS